MKTNAIQNLADFSGNVLIPVFETSGKSSDPIHFEGLEISSKLFFGRGEN